MQVNLQALTLNRKVRSSFRTDRPSFIAPISDQRTKKNERQGVFRVPQSSEKEVLPTQFCPEQQPVVFGKGWTHDLLLEIWGMIMLREGGKRG